VVAARRHMQLPRRLVERVAALLAAVALAACSTAIRDLNLRPERHYQQKVSVVGQVTRMQSVGGDTLIEVTGDRDSRVLIRASGPVAVTVGDWVKVTGVFVPDARVADTNIYDVITAQEISKTGAPWLPNIR
jgi:hypothetical protein